jgi:ketosteroid isomerase-like protein
MSDLAALVRRYVERYNANDVDGMLDCCADDVVFETVTNPGGSIRLNGKDEMREVIEATTRAFRERRHEVVAILVDGSARRRRNRVFRRRRRRTGPSCPPRRTRLHPRRHDLRTQGQPLRADLRLQLAFDPARKASTAGPSAPASARLSPGRFGAGCALSVARPALIMSNAKNSPMIVGISTTPNRIFRFAGSRIASAAIAAGSLSSFAISIPRVPAKPHSTNRPSCR